MEESKNLILTLRSRRTQNFKNQLRSVLLEGYEIFGKTVVEDVVEECRKTYTEYVQLIGEEDE